MVVVDAQASSNIQVLDVKALLTNLLHKVSHDDSCIPENVHLQQADRLAGVTGLQ